MDASTTTPTTTTTTTRGGRKSIDTAAAAPPALASPNRSRRSSNLEVTITRQVHNMTEQGLSNVIFGLHLMGAQWHELSPSLRAAIEESMKMKLMMKKQSSSSSSSSALLRTTTTTSSSSFFQSHHQQYQHHPQHHQQHQQHSLTVLTPYGVSNTLYGLAMIGVNWCSISPGYQKQLETLAADYMPKMNEQGLANTIYS